MRCASPGFITDDQPCRVVNVWLWRRGDAAPVTRGNGPKEHGMRKQMGAWDGSSACVETLEARTLMAADMVLEWNVVAVEATRVARLSPNAQSRALAMVH